MAAARRTDIEPASPYVEGEPHTYLPRIPWKWIFVGVVAVASLAVVYSMHAQRQEQELRSAIERAYAQRVAPAAVRYRAFRTKLEGWITQAAASAPVALADNRLRLEALHRGSGIYLRLNATDAASRATIERGARAMVRDGITACLGIAPLSLRGFYEQGELLMPTWAERARHTNGMMRLRVLDDELTRRSERDIPNLIDMMRASYFLLVLERGPDRAHGPVDVFLWNLRDDQPLLRVRTEAAGALISARIEGTPGSAHIDPERGATAANDCSIAEQVKGDVLHN